MKIYLILLTLLTTLLPLQSQADNCTSCHPQESRQWQQSQHALAMQTADPENVLGDFSQTFSSKDVLARFQQKAGRYTVLLTEGGNTREWRVRYTFGVYPLQQYLIDLGNGRLQALNIAWDSRPASEGGQRWFRLDEPENHPAGHPLHWQGVYQNWNGMCADCHSTGVQKGYAPETDQYATDYAQINVGCSACHDRAQPHARAAREGRSEPAGADLAARGAWLPGTQSTPPRHVGQMSSSSQVNTCGRCHSLRTRLTPSAEGQLHNSLSLNRLFEPLYFADGRVRDEVFVVGSFMQSPMYQAGVVCSNCHNPHSGKLKQPGNALCSQCHSATHFDTPRHHHHPQGAAGSECVSCHMPQTTYMQVDARREHNFTTPNPRTSALAGSPDPCLACHAEWNRAWSAEQVSRLWPNHRERSDWFDVQQDSLPAMRLFLQSERQPEIQRATLIETRADTLAQQAPDLILQQLTAPSPLLRESGWKAALHLPPDQTAPLATRGLSDPALSVRLAAFATLLQQQRLPAGSDAVRLEYERYLNEISDRPSGRALKAQYALLSGQPEVALEDLNIALEKDPDYLPARILLTDLLRARQHFEAAIDTLDQGLASQPGEASLLHLRGLTRLQIQHPEQAIRDLKAAYEAASDNFTYGYRLALVLHHRGKKREAIRIWQRLKRDFPQQPALTSLARTLGH